MLLLGLFLQVATDITNIPQVDVQGTIEQLEQQSLIFRLLLVIIFALLTTLGILWREYKIKDKKLYEALLQQANYKSELNELSALIRNKS